MTQDESAKQRPHHQAPEMGVMFRREQHPAGLIDYARRAESMGFDQLWVVEDCFYLGGVAQAAIALAATDRIKVGLGINPAVARNAAFLAMEYATLAQAFPGRFIGGIGHGVAEWMEQIGEKPASWLRSIEEITTAVRRILRGEDVSVQGTYVNLDQVVLEDAPEVVPPVLLGVRGEKSLRLAGSCADGVLLAEDSAPAYVSWARNQMRSGREDAGLEGDGIVVVYANCVVDDASPADARQRVRDLVARNHGGGLQPSIAPVPFAADMQALVEQGGADALRTGMPDAWLDALAITGSYADARTSVANLVAAGADAVILVPPDDADWNSWLASQEWATIPK